MSYLQAVMLGVVLAGLMWLFAYLVGRFMEAAIDGRPEFKAAIDAIPRRSMLESRFDLRRADLQAEIARQNGEINSLRRKRFALEKDLADARRDAESPIRTVGREGSTTMRFRAWVVNRQVQSALSEGKAHPTLDAEWASPQIVEIWADNVTDARKELQRVYPMPVGFSILNIKLDVPESLAGSPLAEPMAEDAP